MVLEAPIRTFPAAKPRPALTARHVLNRLGCGWSPSGADQVADSGGPEAWVAAQLAPSQVPEAPKIDEVDGWFSYLSTSAAERWRGLFAHKRNGYEYGLALAHWSILRRVYSRRPLLETMVDFWSDHFNVSSMHDRAWIHRFGYDQTIRAFALGRFEDLLIACSLHPAMRLYLDNWLNVAGDPNENQGRELLELHTVGLEAGYTEAMVKDSATILSGYTIDWGGTYEALYDPARHATGAVRVLGFRHENSAKDGQGVATAYLSYLAHHPATATRLARKIATRFVSDVPSEALVAKLARVYRRSGTDIGAVLTALVATPEFKAAANLKVRRPVDDLVATAKVLGVDVGAPTTDSSWASVATYLHGGNQLYFWSRPNGPTIEDPAWCSAGRMFDSFRMHLAQVSGTWPTEATYRSTLSWQPPGAVSLGDFVDHLSRQLFGTPAGDRIKAVGAAALPDYADVRIGQDSPLPWFHVWRLMIALLDTPDHMTR